MITVLLVRHADIDVPPPTGNPDPSLNAKGVIRANELGWPAAAAFLIGYYSMIVGSNVGVAAVLHRWIGLVSDRLYRALLLASSVILAAYGLVLLGQTIESERAPQL